MAKKLPAPAADPSTFSDLDRSSAPEVREEDTDSAWARFEALNSGAEFTPTAPMSLPAPLSAEERAYAATVPSPLDKGAAAPARQRQVSVLEAMDEARRNRRVCPAPEAWLQLYEMLPGKRQVGRTWEPQPPIPREAWEITASINKRMCLRDHIEWADKQGCLNEVLAFLKSLPEESWHHTE
jgi:hypothetical protein